jgi:hypothetical protein
MKEHSTCQPRIQPKAQLSNDITHQMYFTFPMAGQRGSVNILTMGSRRSAVDRALDSKFRFASSGPQCSVSDLSLGDAIGFIRLSRHHIGDESESLVVFKQMVKD